MLNLTETLSAHGERFLVELNRTTFANRRSNELFSMSFRDTLFREDTLYIVIGSDSGLLPQYVRGLEPPESTRYVFIEPDEVAAVLRPRVESDDQLKLFTADEWMAQQKTFHLEDYSFLNRVRILKSLAAQDDHAGIYTDLAWRINSEYQQFQWNTNASLANAPFMRATLLNLPDMLLSSAQLENAFPGKTAVILAGGPSLNQHLDWVGRHRDRFVLISVSRIARVLHQHGLTPDFVFHVDPHKAAFNVSKEALEFPDSCSLVTVSASSQLMVGQWPHLMFYSSDRTPWASGDLNERTLPSAGTNVTNFATHTALNMGFDRIIFLGLDLCFAPDGIGHAKGSTESRTGPNFSAGTTWVRTYGGQEAETTNAFATSIEHFRELAVQARQRGTRLYNLSPEAAFIEGIEFVEADAVELGPASAGAAAFRQRFQDTYFGAEWRRAHYDRVDRELNRVCAILEQIVEKAASARELNQRLFEEGNPDPQRQISGIEALEQEIQSLDQPVFGFLLNYGVRHFLATANRKDADKWSQDETRRYGDNYYRGLKDGAELLLELIRECRDTCALRREELDTDTPVDSLAERWRARGEPLRYRLWERLHGRQLAREWTDGLSAFKDRQWLAADEEDVARCRADSSPEALRNKLNTLFQHRQRQALAAIESFLSSDQTAFSPDYLYLTRGLLAELDDEQEAAMHWYEQIVNIQASPLMEQTLKRVLAISLERQDRDNILGAMQCLSLLSPVYLPYYAEFLNHDGQVVEALDALSEYQSVFPNDVHNLLRVVPIYLQLNLVDGAREVLALAEQLDPENPSIAALKQKVNQKEPCS